MVVKANADDPIHSDLEDGLGIARNMMRGVTSGEWECRELLL